MNRVKFLICFVVASMALAACNKEDNPVTTNIDNPQEQVTDQPANARAN